MKTKIESNLEKQLRPIFGKVWRGYLAIIILGISVIVSTILTMIDPTPIRNWLGL